MTLTNSTVEVYGTMFGIFLVAVLQQYNSWRAKQAITTVKTDLNTSTQRRDSVMANIHSLVNGNMTAKLQELADLTAALAAATGNPAHQALADQAACNLKAQQLKTDEIDNALSDALDKCPLNPQTLCPLGDKFAATTAPGGAGGALGNPQPPAGSTKGTT